MANKTQTIQISSILGGIAPATHMARSDQFRSAFAIDPSLSVDNSSSHYFSQVASGLIRPVGAQGLGGTTTTKFLWLIPNPKNTASDDLFAYDSAGSAYSMAVGAGASALSDGGSLTNSSGNGCEYYDNYIYFAKDTTIARYGPLDGSPGFDGDYWVTTLGKTALNNTIYPADPYVGQRYANHMMHRHSDGRLYIADVTGNQGIIHYIQTTKTTVEGDTNNGSTYGAITFGYGLYPIAIESYGSDLAIAFLEGHSDAANFPLVKAKIAFWDTTSANFNSITWVEFPDALITGLKNANGVLYAFSGSDDDFGVRVSRFVGGYTYEEVGLFEHGFSPHQGALLARGSSILFGSTSTLPDSDDITPAFGCIWSIGPQHKNNLASGLFNIARVGDRNNGEYTSSGVLSLASTEGNFNELSILAGWDGGIDWVAASNLLAPSSPPMWWSQTYKIGRPFKITKIIIPTMESTTASTKQIAPKLYFDNGARFLNLQLMDYSDKRVFTLRPQNAVGEMDFFLELRWTAAGVWTVGLPITIEYEIIDS